MSYDFSNVAKISIPEGEVNKITNASGSVVWRKPYVWTEYTVVTSIKYDVTWSDNSSSQRYTTSAGIPNDLQAWSGYNVNDSAEFEGSGQRYTNSGGLIAYATSHSYSTYPYVTYFDGENRIWKVISVTYSSNMDSFTIKYYTGTVTSSSVESRGITTGRFMISNNASAYPVNGIQNGYWYLRTQIGYTK